MEWNKSMNEKIYCRIRRVRAVFLTFFLTAAVVLTDAQNIREKEYEKTEIICCIGDSITYGSGLEDEERLTDIRKQVYLAAAVQRGEELHNFEKNLRTVRDAFLMYGGKEYLERVLKRKIQLPLDSRELIEVLVECMRRG